MPCFAQVERVAVGFQEGSRRVAGVPAGSP